MKAYPYTVMRCAMLFSVYTAARPGEVRYAEWSEIKGDVWDIHAENMNWLFPSPRNDGHCMSENGVRVALRAIGFTKEQITPHGFRAMFSATANRHGINRDVIERQLAHVEGNSVRGAYNNAEYMPERVKLM